MRAIIGIGVPGSGKTTVLKTQAGEMGFTYVNADDIRQELTGDPKNHTMEDAVWELAYQRIRQALTHGPGVIIDATHARQRNRRNMITFCRNHGATTIIGTWFDVPLETCLTRNRQRPRQVPEEAIRNMHRWLQMNPPSLDEGFDELRKVH